MTETRAGLPENGEALPTVHEAWMLDIEARLRDAGRFATALREEGLAGRADLVDALASALRTAREDSVRLDWIATRTPSGRRGPRRRRELWPDRIYSLLIAETDGVWEVGVATGAGFNGFSDGKGANLRAALDAARAAASPTPSGGTTNE